MCICGVGAEREEGKRKSRKEGEREAGGAKEQRGRGRWDGRREREKACCLQNGHGLGTHGNHYQKESQ